MDKDLLLELLDAIIKRESERVSIYPDDEISYWFYKGREDMVSTINTIVKYNDVQKTKEYIEMCRKSVNVK